MPIIDHLLHPSSPPSMALTPRLLLALKSVLAALGISDTRSLTPLFSNNRSKMRDASEKRPYSLRAYLSEASLYASCEVL